MELHSYSFRVKIPKDKHIAVDNTEWNEITFIAIVVDFSKRCESVRSEKQTSWKFLFLQISDWRLRTLNGE